MYVNRQVRAHQFDLVTKLGRGGPHVDHGLVVIAHVLRPPVRSPRDFRPGPSPVLRRNALYQTPTCALPSSTESMRLTAGPHVLAAQLLSIFKRLVFSLLLFFIFFNNLTAPQVEAAQVPPGQRTR